MMLNKKFKPLYFTLVALFLFVVVSFMAVFGLRWLAALYDTDHDRYSLWLAIETLLSSVAISLFIFYRQLSPHEFDRGHSSHGALNESDAQQAWKRTWWVVWLFAFVFFSIPTCIEIISYGLQGMVRLALMAWWGADLYFAGRLLFDSHRSARKTDIADEGVEQQRIRVQRSWLNVAVFSQCLLATIITDHVLIWLCWIAATILISSALVIRTVVQPFDHRTLLGQGFLWLFRNINRVWEWHDLPKWVAVANLAALREELRVHNLHSTSEGSIATTCPRGLRPIPLKSPDAILHRHSEGFFNDPKSDTMGISSWSPDGAPTTNFTLSHPDARFGRNMPFESLETDPARLLVPNPRIVSCKLLSRDESQENRGTRYVKSINLLAAAWIQFQTHDWFSHGEPIPDDPIQIDTSNDPPHDRWPEATMRVRRTRPDPTRMPDDHLPSFVPLHADKASAPKKSNLGCPMTFVNSEAHWWDASQLYGSKTEHTDQLKKPGCPFMPSIHNPNGHANTGFYDNWWVGLAVLHELFVKEHNAICNALRATYPDWKQDLIFEKARLINTALMAKIHTVEWTPAILNNPALEVSMNANWSGLFTQKVIDAFGRLGLNEAFWGIPASGINHHSAPYALTEEFVSVYRMHSLIPDEIHFQSISSEHSKVYSTMQGQGVVGEQSALSSWNEFQPCDLLYTFGIRHPGSLTLHNYPNSLRRFTKPGESDPIDLATIDILRDRERQVPRYNRFRKELRMRPIESFDELNTPQSPTTGQELREVYGVLPDGRDNVDDIDLLVGTLAESKPEGFGFSDTTFRIFILMASRRLKSDRFTAKDFTSEIYTELGIHWVNTNTMKDVLLRHFPELSSSLYGIENAFKPWRTRVLKPDGSAEWTTEA